MGRRYPWHYRVGIILATLALFALACALPALYFREPDVGSWPGIMFLVIGVFGIFFGAIGWFANIFLLVSLVVVLFRKWIASAIIAFIGLLIALTSVQLLFMEIPLDEGGVRDGHPTWLGPGFFVWLLSFLVVIVGSIVARVTRRF